MVVEEVVIAIRELLQLKCFDQTIDKEGNNKTEKDKNIEKILKKLIKVMPTIKTPYARSSIIWLVTQNINILESIAPDFLRICIKGFISDVNKYNFKIKYKKMVEPKLQILNLAAKLFMIMPSKVYFKFFVIFTRLKKCVITYFCLVCMIHRLK